MFTFCILKEICKEDRLQKQKTNVNHTAANPLGEPPTLKLFLFNNSLSIRFENIMLNHWFDITYIF